MNERQRTRRPTSTASTDEKIAALDAHAEELLDKEKYAAASRQYEEALRLEKKPNARAYFTGQIGICQYNLGNDRDALKHLLKSAQPPHPRVTAELPFGTG